MTYAIINGSHALEICIVLDSGKSTCMTPVGEQPKAGLPT